MRRRCLLRRSRRCVAVAQNAPGFFLDLVSGAPKRLARLIEGDVMASTLLQRRHFMVSAAAMAAAAGLHTTQLWAKTIKHKPLDPVNPDRPGSICVFGVRVTR